MLTGFTFLQFVALCRALWPWLLTVLILQGLIILTMPLAGDEAYFVAWGKKLSWVYYDHPPLTGWVSWVLGQLSTSGYLHRLFSVLLGLLTCLLFFRFLTLRYDLRHAKLIAPLLLSIPITLLLFSLFVNDSLLFSALALFYCASFLSFHHALEKTGGSWRYTVLAGVGLGLAMLVKFTALVYFVGVVLFLLLNPRYYGFLFRQMFVVGLLGFAFFLVTVVANYYNCGVNFAFNFVFRESVASFAGLWQLLGSLLLLLGPMIFYWHPLNMIRHFREHRYFFSSCFVLTVVLLGMISFTRGEFGLHWAAPAVLLGLLATAEQLTQNKAQVLLRWNMVYSLLIILPLSTGLFLLSQGSPMLLQHFSEKFQYRALQINDLQNGSLIADIQQRFPDALLVSDSYGIVSMIEAHGGAETAMMFNENSKFGRNHDIFRDYRDYEGRNILVISTEFDDDGDFAEQSVVFEEAREVTINGDQGSYRALFGERFNYSSYYNSVIRKTFSKLYDRIPQLYAACYMDRYRQ